MNQRRWSKFKFYEGRASSAAEWVNAILWLAQGIVALDRTIINRWSEGCKTIVGRIAHSSRATIGTLLTNSLESAYLPFFLLLRPGFCPQELKIMLGSVRIAYTFGADEVTIHSFWWRPHCLNLLQFECIYSEYKSHGRSLVFRFGVKLALMSMAHGERAYRGLRALPQRDIGAKPVRVKDGASWSWDFQILRHNLKYKFRIENDSYYENCRQRKGWEKMQNDMIMKTLGLPNQDSSTFWTLNFLG